MPANWKVLMVIVTIFLAASVVIGAVQLITTPTEVFGVNFEGLPKSEFPR